MSKINLNSSINPSKKDLMVFGMIWSFIFFAITFYGAFKYGEINFLYLFIAGFIFAISAIYPRLYHKFGIYKTWIIFGNFVGNINSKIIIFALFYVVFCPIGIFLKLIGKDLLRKKLDKNVGTYFINRDVQPHDMQNQF